MNLNDIPLFAMLKGKLVYESRREAVIAQNVANADTADYAPRDMKPFTFDQTLKAQASLSLTETNPGHMQIASSAGATGATGVSGAAGAGGGDDQVSPDSEVRLDGNHVVLEDQMMKLTQSRMDYDAAVGLYQQSLQLLKTAIKKPGS